MNLTQESAAAGSLVLEKKVARAKCYSVELYMGYQGFRRFQSTYRGMQN